jgi:hypothetical protein
MSQYLLLRDNKQSGPYSLDELITKGLKPYDLVWLNGKSAAWRYPSEIAELKPYAPAVEEQPYDRFYKKPVTQQQELPVTSVKKEIVTAMADTVPPTVETPPATVKNIPAKKIYVTMPAANGHVAASTPVYKETSYEAYQPKPVDEPVKSKPVTAPVTVNDTVGAGSFTEQVAADYYSQYEERMPAMAPAPRRRMMTGKLVMRSLVAACLILGGIVIGLAISNRQLKQQQNLDSLVKQIQEREKARQAARINNLAVQEQPTITVEPPPVNNTTLPSKDDVGAVSDRETIKRSAETKKETPAQVPDTRTVAEVEQAKHDVSVTPAVLNTHPIRQKVTRYDKPENMESARKNIYQLVAVEGSKYKTGVLGGISDLHLTISNNSPYPLDQVAVEIKYLGTEKKMVKTQTILFNDIAPGEQKTLEAPRSNRGISVDYAITRINSRVLGLAQVGL